MVRRSSLQGVCSWQGVATGRPSLWAGLDPRALMQLAHLSGYPSKIVSADHTASLSTRTAGTPGRQPGRGPLFPAIQQQKTRGSSVEPLLSRSYNFIDPSNPTIASPASPASLASLASSRPRPPDLISPLDSARHVRVGWASAHGCARLLGLASDWLTLVSEFAFVESCFPSSVVRFLFTLLPLLVLLSALPRRPAWTLSATLQPPSLVFPPANRGTGHAQANACQQGIDKHDAIDQDSPAGITGPPPDSTNRFNNGFVFSHNLSRVRFVLVIADSLPAAVRDVSQLWDPDPGPGAARPPAGSSDLVR